MPKAKTTVPKKASKKEGAVKKKAAPKRASSKTIATGKKLAAFSSNGGNGQPQALAVRKKMEVEVNHFSFPAVPVDFKKELFTDNEIKRFHGSRLLFSWLPLEFFTNNQDRFGYLFPQLQRAVNMLPYTAANRDLLERLGNEIGSKEAASTTGSTISDSIIPAGYTYLGQFIDHDITLDVNSDISQEQNAAKIPNMRSPSLDLDAVYGNGPAIDAFLYDHRVAGPAKGVKLLLGINQNAGDGGPSLSNGSAGNPATIAGGNNFDVQRTMDGTAIIGDPRNDENLIVSQLHHAFIKFHNKVVDHLIGQGASGDLFTAAKTMVTHHYQWVVVHDFLKRIARPEIVDKVLQNGPKFFKGNKLFMPVEFSVAAYRFGHSIIRNDYFVNGPLVVRPASLGDIFSFIRVPRVPVLSNWVIDFNLFFPARALPGGVAFNMARRIDTRLALGLGQLPGETGNFMPILAKRNLVRGMALKLPSGQAVARHIGAPVLTEAELQQDNGPVENAILNEQSKLLLKKTPLWYYILKEAEIKEGGNRLGTVGSTIVAETFVRLLQDDPNSFLQLKNPKFKPSLPRFGSKPPGDFDMTDLLQFAGILSLD